MQIKVRVVRLLIVACVCGAAGKALAQGIAPAVPEKKEEKRVLEVGKWYPWLEGGLNLTQSAYSDNWKGGETGTVSWSAYLNGSAERQINPGLNWLNTMKLLYGQTRREEVDANGDRNWGDAEKSVDQADLESMFRLTRGWAVDPYLSLRWESYFQDVTDPFGRELWFNPMTFKESAGIARKFADSDRQQLLARLGITARETYRRFFAASTGDETFSETAWDSGAELVIDHVIKFNPNVTYTSRTSFYQPFNWSKTDVFDALGADSLVSAGLDSDIADYTTTIDIDYQMTLAARVAKALSVQLFMEFLYDKYDNTIVPVVENGTLTNPGAVDYAVRKKGQFKETLGIGLVWTLD
jgi:hypothetical protein